MVNGKAEGLFLFRETRFLLNDKCMNKKYGMFYCSIYFHLLTFSKTRDCAHGNKKVDENRYKTKKQQ